MTTEGSLAARLSHVRWIGGGSGAGKSTVASRLAERHGLYAYSTDESIQAHLARSTAARHPLMHAFREMTMDERWLDRAPDVMLRTFHGFQGEGFEFIVDDLLALSPDRPVLVEGFRLLPRLVAPLLSRSDQAIWLLPTPRFREAAFDARGSTWRIADQTSNPARALENLLQRDAMFTDEVGAEAAALGLTTVHVDISVGVTELVEQAGRALGLGDESSRHIL